ncbi:hypothetical protein [Endozoicomonas sp. ONNA2]|nr:hypothetical protein [Endozoicomonas sp. ONNA2]
MKHENPEGSPDYSKYEFKRWIVAVVILFSQYSRSEMVELTSLKTINVYV